MRPPRSKLQIWDFSQSLGLTNVSAGTTAGEKRGGAFDTQNLPARDVIPGTPAGWGHRKELVLIWVSLLLLPRPRASSLCFQLPISQMGERRPLPGSHSNLLIEPAHLLNQTSCLPAQTSPLCSKMPTTPLPDEPSQEKEGERHSQVI